MKCLEKMVQSHIISCLPSTLDRHQLAYWENRSTENAAATTLHAALSHLEQPETYVRLLFVDFSSALTHCFHKLVHKLTGLGLSDSISWWILDVLLDCSPRVRVGTHSPQPQHRIPTGLCAEPPVLHIVHTLLQPLSPQQYHH